MQTAASANNGATALASKIAKGTKAAAAVASMCTVVNFGRAMLVTAEICNHPSRGDAFATFRAVAGNDLIDQCPGSAEIQIGLVNES